MKVKNLLKITDVIRVDPQDSLSSVLSQLESSHDAGFVFEGKKFIGVVSPYYCIFKKAYPGNTKVHSCLIHPPKLHLEDSVEKAARLMVESKIHYLPVVKDDNSFAGIVSARRILKYLLNEERYAKDMHKKIGDKKIITILDQDTISKALNLFKENKISKLIMVNRQGALAGIVSQYDIADLVGAPREGHGFDSGGGDKNSQLEKPIRNYGRARVVTLPETATYVEAIQHILEKKIGSIVMVGVSQKPVGIVTTKDFLNFMLPKRVQKGIEVSLRDFDAQDKTALQEALKSIETKLKKHGIHGGSFVARGRHGGGVYEATLSYTNHQGFISIHLEGKRFSELMTALINKVSSQINH